MNFSKILLTAGVCVGSISAVSGCVPLILGGAATAGYMASQERGAKATLMDTKIKTHVKDKLTNMNYKLLASVEVTVLQGDVLLSGVVSDAETARGVEKVVLNTPDVNNVYNQLFTDGIYPTKQYTTDSWIATQARARLLGAKDVYSINYMINVVNSTVYVMGLAETQGEMERVIHILRTTKGVKKVVNFVRLYDGSHLEVEAPSSFDDE